MDETRVRDLRPPPSNYPLPWSSRPRTTRQTWRYSCHDLEHHFPSRTTRRSRMGPWSTQQSSGRRGVRRGRRCEKRRVCRVRQKVENGTAPPSLTNPHSTTATLTVATVAADVVAGAAVVGAAVVAGAPAEAAAVSFFSVLSWAWSAFIWSAGERVVDEAVVTTAG